MKNVKVFLLAVLFSIFGANFIHAQDKPATQTAQPNAADLKAVKQNGFQKVIDELSLTPEQQTPYKEIFKKFTTAVNEVRTSALDKDQKAIKYNEIAQQKETELKALLTPEQYSNYSKLLEERRLKFIEMKKKQVERQEAMKIEKEKQPVEASKGVSESKDVKESKGKESKVTDTKAK